MQNNNNRTFNNDSDVLLSYNNESWKSYIYIYDVAIDYLLKLHAPTIQDFQKVLSEVASEQVIRSAFYSAFYTKQVIINNSNSSNNKLNSNSYNSFKSNNNSKFSNSPSIEIINNDNSKNQQQQYEVTDDIYINQSWLDYFSTRIQYKSSNNMVFKVKRFKKANALEDFFGISTNSVSNKHKNDNNFPSNNLFKKIKTETDPTLYFQPQDISNNSSNNYNGSNNYNSTSVSSNKDDHLRVVGDDDDSVLKYRYEKDFILIKNGKPHIITLSPDWGIPFHFKNEVQQDIPLANNINININRNNKNNSNNNNKQSNNNNNSNNKNKNKKQNSNNNNEDGDSWCGLM